MPGSATSGGLTFDPMQFKACDLRNSGDAYRRFHAAGFFAGAHERAMALFAHPFCGGLIAVMATAGALATVITHFVL